MEAIASSSDRPRITRETARRPGQLTGLEIAVSGPREHISGICAEIWVKSDENLKRGVHRVLESIVQQ